MAITLDNTENHSISSAATSTSWAHTVGATANCLVVAVGLRDGISHVTQISVGGQTLTKEIDQTSSVSTSIWYLFNPPTGAQTISVTMSSRDRAKGFASYSLIGVDTTAIGNSQPGDFGVGVNPSTNITASAGSWVFDAAATSVSSATVYTVGADQTAGINEAITSGSFDGSVISSYESDVAAGTVTMSHTLPSGAGGGNDQSVLEVKAAGGATTPTVTTQAASSIAETTATLNGNVTDDGGETVTERGFYWSTSATVTTGDTKVTTAGTTGAYTFDLTGLTGSTTYYYRAFATNSEGTTLDSSDTSFTTTAAATAPAAFTAGQWTLTDLTTGGDARIAISALPSDGGSAITDLEYKKDAGAWTTLGGTTTGNYDLSVFTDGVSADIQIRAVNSVGDGADSDTKSVTTTAAAFTPADTDVIYVLDVSNTTNSPEGEFIPVPLADLKTYFNL